MSQFVVTIGDRGADEVHLKIDPRQALYLAQRILNQLDLKSPTDVTMIVSADVREVAS